MVVENVEGCDEMHHLPGWIRPRGCGAELDDGTIGKSRNCEPEMSVSLSLRKFVASSVLFTKVRWDPYTNKIQICLKNGNQVATWKTKELKNKKSTFSWTIFKPILMEEISRNYLKSQRSEINHMYGSDMLHVMNVKFQTQSYVRDFSQDRQLEIHSTLWSEEWNRPTNKDGRSRNFISRNSPRLRVGR